MDNMFCMVLSMFEMDIVISNYGIGIKFKKKFFYFNILCGIFYFNYNIFYVI